MIQAARRFLYASTYYVEWDDYGIAFLDAVLDAQGRGVTVNLLIDGFGQQLGGVLMSVKAKTQLAAHLELLRAAGATVTVYRPPHLIQRRFGGGQHVKIQVSEQGDAIFGSSNITRSSFEGWNEYSVALRGPVARLLLESYRQLGGEVLDEHLAMLEAPRDATADLELDYWFCNPNLHQGAYGPLGWRGRNVVTDRMVDMLNAARQHIRLTCFYFKPVRVLVTALVAAARRGVTVEVYHSHRNALPATDLAWIAAAVGYQELLAAGVRIYENRRGEHSKIVLVDDNWVAFGSYNFENAAHDRLAEAMLATHDSRGIAPAQLIFAGLRSDPDNVLVDQETIRRYSLGLRLRLAGLGRFKRWM